MIIQDIESTVINNTTTATQKFGFQMTPLISKVLYTHLYEDKEHVVLQELAANALDAQVENNTQSTPIRIILPTELEPELVVQDCGIGMSLDTVNNIFTSWGGSTKTKSNESIGGFGFGAKTPLALVGSFTVETTHKGITTMLACFLDNGDPSFSVFSSADVGRTDGTIVRVPISDDTVMRRLSSTATTMFAFWEVTPLITNGSATTPLQEIKDYIGTVIENTDHYALRTDMYRYDRVFSVLVGPVRYRVPSALIESIEEQSSEIAHMLSTLRRDVRLELLPKFKIGELELSPSREYIEPTKDNLETLLSRLKLLIIQVSKDEYPTTYEAYKKAVDVLKKYTINAPSAPYSALGMQSGYLPKALHELFGGSLSILSASLVFNMYQTGFSTYYEKWIKEVDQGTPEDFDTYATTDHKSLPVNTSSYINRHKATTQDGDHVPKQSIYEFYNFSSLLIPNSGLTTTESLIRKYKDIVLKDVPVKVSQIKNSRMHSTKSSFNSLYNLPTNLLNSVYKVSFVHTNQDARKHNVLVRSLLDTNDYVYVFEGNIEIPNTFKSFLDEHTGDKELFTLYTDKDVEDAYEARPKRVVSASTGTRQANTNPMIGSIYYSGSNLRQALYLADLEHIKTDYPDADKLFVFPMGDETDISNSATYGRHSLLTNYDNLFLRTTISIFLYSASAKTKRVQSILKELETTLSTILCLGKDAPTIYTALSETKEYIEYKDTLIHNTHMMNVLIPYVGKYANGTTAQAVLNEFTPLFKSVTYKGEKHYHSYPIHYDATVDTIIKSNISSALLGEYIRFIDSTNSNEFDFGQESPFTDSNRSAIIKAVKLLLKQ